MTMGVISLLGSTQSKLIWDKLYDRLGPEVILQRQLRSGEAASFQGDERDVIIITTVVAVDPGIPSGRVSAMTGNTAMRRINVAASRARQQMWVVHSVEPDRFPDGDLRGALIRHCRTAGVTTAPPADLLEACESQFERDVLQKILARGYRKVSVQHNVGRYRIDIVIEGPHARLAVECDGDRWHGPDVWHKDRARQQVLERANWTFERIRGSAFYRDPETALLPLWDRLTDLGIPTGDWWSLQTPQPTFREVSGQGKPPDLTRAEEVAGESKPVPDEAVHRSADSGDPLTTSEFGQSASGGEFAAPGAEASAPDGAGDAANPFNHAADRNGAYRSEQWDRDKDASASTPSSSSLPLYRAWTPRLLPHPDAASQPDIIAGLLDIVAVEGPIHAQRAYRLYTQAAGGLRVGPEMRRIFLSATRRALRTGALHQLDELLAEDEKTLYIPGQSPVLVREIGPRQLSDVPRSEVAQLVKNLNLGRAAPDVVKRAVLNAYGLIRLTVRASQYLDECQSYGSQRSTTT